MPIACRYKIENGRQFCGSDCPASAPCGGFRYVRIEAPEDLPPADERAVDVAVLDFNFGWANLGHDSLVHAILETACDLLPVYEATGVHLRVLSFAVRHRGMLPDLPGGGRFTVYAGTGGPGHIDPHCNDGVSAGSQGVREDPSWEAPAFALFDAIRADPDAALLAVCHSYGVLCRWSGVARPVLRGAFKGGKRSGIFEDVLSPAARRHPWFSRFAAGLPGGCRVLVLENRLYDLIPEPGAAPAGFVPLGYEADGDGDGCGGGAGLTMMELARDRGGVMPRIFAVNHHPEIVDRARQKMLLEQKLERGEVTREWYQERLDAMTRTYADEDSERRLHRTSDYTLLTPLRFHLERQVRLRAEALGKPVALHEDATIEAFLQA